MNNITIAAQSERLVLRYAALLAIATNVIFNFLSITLFSHPSVEEVISSFPILFSPSGYTFSIWIVHFLFISYTIFQVSSKNLQSGFDKIATPLIISNIFELTWQYAFIQGRLNIGMMFLTGMLISAGCLYVIAQKELEKTNASAFWKVPFKLYLAWTSVITISAVSSWLNSIGWDMNGFSESTWTISMIVFTAALGILMAFGRQDNIFSLVMAWVNISIGLKFSQSSSEISFTALAIGIFLIWCTLVSAIQTSSVSKEEAQAAI